MVKKDNLSKKIFDLLKGNGLSIMIFDETGAETVDPLVGRRFFSAAPNTNLMITIDEDNGVVEFNKGKSFEDNSKLRSLQMRVKELADEFQMNSDIKIFGKEIQPRDFAFKAKMKKDTAMMEGYKTNSLLRAQILSELEHAQGMTADALRANIAGSRLNDVQEELNTLLSSGGVEVISELNGAPVYGKTMVEAVMESFSKMFGSQRTSQQTLENVRILVKHKTPVDENVRGARSRHISAIFLECNGERFRFPHNYLPGARAMAQHMAHGGAMGDKVGTFISESTDNLLKLQSFNRYVTTNKLINEDSSGIVETVKENIDTIRKDLHKLTGVKTYETVSARIETFEREALEENDVSGLKDLFTIRRFDEKFEEVLPIVKQLVQERDTFRKRIEEAAANTVVLRREAINTTPMFEFTSEHSRLGFKLSELALRIVENEELSTFVGKIGSKLSRDGSINQFERAVLEQVFENSRIMEQESAPKEIKESLDLSAAYDKYIMNFY